MKENNLIDILVNEIIEAINANPPSLEDLERLLEEANDMMGGPYFKQQPIDNQNLLRDAKRDLEQKIAQLENSQTSGSKTSNADDEQPSDFYEEATGSSTHNPKAEEWMNKAETAFYAGKYQESVGLYENVLELEPTWERARQHKEQALEYLQTGYIPSDKLPSEAAILFGKAQSAARVLNFQRAKDLLDEAKDILRESNIPRWREGQEFEDELNKTEEAKTAYELGLEEFNQGNIDEAINRVQAAADLAGIPSYKEKANELREVRETISLIRQDLFTQPLTSKVVLQASSKLNALQASYPGNSLLDRLQAQKIRAMQQITGQLFEDVRQHFDEAQRATSISDAERIIEDTESYLKTLRTTGIDDDIISKLSKESERLSKLKTKTNQAARRLEQAKDAQTNNKYFAAWRLLKEVRQDYPRDSEVEDLGQRLAWMNWIRSGIILVIIIAAVVFIGFGVRFISNEINDYWHSQTPSPTPTATLPPPTKTPLPTATSTPLPTKTPTLTPTPITMLTKRSIYVRVGCYGNYELIGKIPTSATVYLLPMERRFDRFDRECVLIDYRGDTEMTGWVLLEDLEP